jgi:8-oxo-dGTP diphosphatase
LAEIKYCYFKKMKLSDYPQPSVTTDIVIFSIREKELNLLLVKRGVAPFKGKWAIPGGFVGLEESLENAAKRELKEETGVEASYLEQLYTFGDVKRDPRGRVISIAYFALMNSNNVELKATTDVSDTKWFSIKKLPELSFDHKEILNYALQRLRWKFEYTTVAFSLLPKKFSLTQLQKIYEAVFDKKFDKRNFRKKILSLGIVKETKDIQKDVSFRPAQLYYFVGKLGEIVKII